MINKTLIAGIVGFLIGGLIVSIAATTFDKSDDTSSQNSSTMSSMSMEEMAVDLKDKTGDEFDRAFIADMIEHHEGAVAMAKLSATNAKHDEIRQLSNDIIVAQEKEISEMTSWQAQWGYNTSSPSGMNSMHHN